MTESQFSEGRGYWLYYVKINGYAFRPTEAGLQKIARLLDLNVPYLRKTINVYLEA